MEIFEEEEKSQKIKYEFPEGLTYSWRAPSFSEVVLGDLRHEDVVLQLERWRKPIPYYTREEIERLDER